MADDEQLSPEEKLLKVIQNTDDEDENASSGATPEPAPAATRPAARAPAAVKSAPPAAGGTEEESPEAPAPAAPAGKLSSPSGRAYGLANRCLAVVVVVMLALVLLEFWMNIEATAALQRPLGPGPADGSGISSAVSSLPPLDEILAGMEARNAFAHPDEVASGAAAGPVETGTSEIRTGWRLYATKNLDLIGRTSSGPPDAPSMEAIIVDRKEGRMHILREGDTFVVAEKEIELESIGAEEVVLTDGVGTLTLK